MKESLFIYSKNGEMVEVKTKPFIFELAMEGYIVDNSNLLSNDALGLTNPEIKDTEKILSNATRTDIIVQYDNDMMAVVELKNVSVNDAALTQLDGYLKTLISKKEEDVSQWTGILVGPEVEDAVLRRIKTDKTLSAPIFVVELNRYFDNGNWFNFTKWHIPSYWNKTSKDYTKYVLNHVAGPLGKGRLVHEVIKDYIAKHPGITFDDLQRVFPDSLRTQTTKKVKNHVVALEEDVDVEDRYARYFKEALLCADGNVVVSSQWGIGNINNFIERAKELGYSINEVK